MRFLCWVGVLLGGLAGVAAACCVAIEDEARERLWAAVRNGDLAAVTSELDAGSNVNALNEIGISALWIAAGNDQTAIAELLIERGADVNVRDGIWYQTPLSQAVGNGNLKLVERLVAAGAADLDAAAMAAAGRRSKEVLQALLATERISQDARDAALFATPEELVDIRQLLVAAGAKALPVVAAQPSWERYVGEYFNENGRTIQFVIAEVGLAVQAGGGKPIPCREIRPGVFQQLGNPNSDFRFDLVDDRVQQVALRRFTAETMFFPLKPVAAPTQAAPESTPGDAPQIPWPQFRGPDGRGVADGQHPPVGWDVETGKNVVWKTPIPGLGHSCPVIWGNRIFLTTAISGDPDPQLRIGNYGDVDSVNDETEHTWQVLCLDLDGKVLWTQTAFQGVPKIKRHLKGSHANCTPATDGTRVVACFGAEGLYCYDFDGKLLWKRDLSSIDSSFAIDRQYEWGFASSPIIYNDTVIVQFDLSRDSFIAAYSLEDGSRVWSTPRDEIPSWSSPVLWRNKLRSELVTNASQYARSYDPATGEELWRLAKKSEATIPAPVVADDLVLITSGNRPIQPIFAVRAGAQGDISLPSEEATHSEFIAWRRLRGGPYMPTPIVYGPYLYVCSNAGILACYEVASGRELYRERMGGESYTASPVAADGCLYFVSEQGEVRVVKAGPDFELLAVNKMGEICMAVPAISGGRLYIRSQHALFALGHTGAE